jgi:Tfp pilus assembly protein PilN
MGFPMRAFIAALIAAALFTQTAYAQHKAPADGPSEKQKAEVQAKRAYQKDTDEAYKSTIDKIPDSKKTADPWGSMRTPSGTAGAK